MEYLFSRMRSLVAGVFLPLLAIVSPAQACMIFTPPDPDFWAVHASSIVDATVIGFDRKPLAKTVSSAKGHKGPITWVLTLDVHMALRGPTQGVLQVATRFSNTTAVDEEFVRSLLGSRNEFALVDFIGAAPTAFADSSQAQETTVEDGRLPPHDGLHVWDDTGQPLDEIWEGLCTSLPIFEVGTFGN